MATPPSNPLLPPPSPHVESVTDPSPHAKSVTDAVLLDSTDPLLPPPPTDHSPHFEPVIDPSPHAKSVPDTLLDRRIKNRLAVQNIEPKRNR